MSSPSELDDSLKVFLYRPLSAPLILKSTVTECSRQFTEGSFPSPTCHFPENLLSQSFWRARSGSPKRFGDSPIDMARPGPRPPNCIQGQGHQTSYNWWEKKGKREGTCVIGGNAADPAALEVQPPPVHVAIVSDLKDGEMPLCKQKMLGVFQRLAPPIFSGAIGEDAYEFQITCQEQLQSLGLLESRGADFTTHQFRGPARQWWCSYREFRPAGSAHVSWSEFSEAFLARYSGSQTRGTDSYDRPRQRFQHGQSSRPVKAALPASEGGQHHQGGRSTGQSSRGSDSLPSYHGRVTSGRSSSGCFDCSALDHWSRECPQRWRGATVPALIAPRPISAVPPLARGGGRTRVVGTADRVPEAELGEAG
ncbi:hypothetical protein MTR67_007119 [Solanum verrucosum]|uniref:Retrotransposon gag domain-containing protein n=1 Tax=Solanum verrucosum TaxID=315347 RepID=A0AAF0TCT3_SOLVR|nr:hypothetical protein MTR67_007119 [Solanum verrucosum]